MIMKKILYAIIVVLSLARHTAQDCTGMDLNLGMVNCTYTNLEISGFSIIPSNAYTFDVSQSNLTVIPSGTFSQYVQLVNLSLEYNNVQTLEPGAFNGLNNLQALSLRGNYLKNVEKGVFNSLNALTQLDLSNNLVATIEEGAFMGCMGLSSVILENNLLTNITKEVCSMQRLYLSDNSISSLCSDVVFNAKLEYLNASNNAVQHLEARSFQNAASLTVLDLSKNLLAEISPYTFNFTYNLQHLSLMGNKLKQISVGTFLHLSKLEYLDLSNNSIQYLDYGVFFGLVNLKTLDVSNNKLVALSEYNLYYLENLEVLRFAGNYITFVDASYICRSVTSAGSRKVSMKGNQFSCSDLVTIIRHLNKCAVEVEQGSAFNVKNIQGIACSDSKSPTGIVDKNILFATSRHEDLQNSKFSATEEPMPYMENTHLLLIINNVFLLVIIIVFLIALFRNALYDFIRARICCGCW